MDNKEAILGSIPAEHKEEGVKLYTSLLEEKGGFQTLLKYMKENDPDKLSIALASSLDIVAELELLQAPGLSFLLPQQYLEYPRESGPGNVPVPARNACVITIDSHHQEPFPAGFTP